MKQLEILLERPRRVLTREVVADASIVFTLALGLWVRSPAWNWVTAKIYLASSVTHNAPRPMTDTE
jgi:hypothetical protein